jgi:hypothetical protein
MADENTAFLERLQKRGGGDFLKELAEAVLDRLMQRGGARPTGGFSQSALVGRSSPCKDECRPCCLPLWRLKLGS